MLQNIMAVVAGFILWSVLWLGTNAVLPRFAPNSFQDDGSTTSVPILLLLLIVSFICSIAAGYVTARVGGAMLPAQILAVILLLVGIAVQSQFWNLLPLWYHIIFLVALLPATLLGARLV